MPYYLAMEFLADPNQCVSMVEQRGRNAESSTTQQRTTRHHSRCKGGCCKCLTPTSLRCMGICFTGTLLLIVGTVMIALYFTASQTKIYLIPALVLFILGIIFISIAEWFCRVKIYHRYGRNHMRTLERLSGIERRLNSGVGNSPETEEQPPPYNCNVFVPREIPSVTVRSYINGIASVGESRNGTLELNDDVPSYSISVSGDVLPSYHEATSSQYGKSVIKKEEAEAKDIV